MEKKDALIFHNHNEHDGHSDMADMNWEMTWVTLFQEISVQFIMTIIHNDGPQEHRKTL